MKKEFKKILEDEFDCLEIDLDYIIKKEGSKQAVINCMTKAFELRNSSPQFTCEDAEFIYDSLPMCYKKAPKGLDPTMYLTLTQEGDQVIVDKVKRILKQ